MNDKPKASNPYLPNDSYNEPAPFAPYFSDPTPTPYGPTQPELNAAPIVPAPYGTPVNSVSPQNDEAQQSSYTSSQPYAQQGYEPARPQPYYLQQTVENPANQLALIAFIVSLSTIFFGLFASITSIILGHIALNQMKNGLANNRWMAISALSLGYAGVALMGFVALVWFSLFFSY